MNTEDLRHRRIENLLISSLAVTTVIVLIAGFFPATRFSVMVMHNVEMKRMASRASCVVMLIAVVGLFQRKRMAWIVTAAMLTLNAVRHLIPPVHSFSLVFSALDILGLILFILLRQDFCCPSEAESVKKGILFLLFAFAGIVLNAGISYHFVKSRLAGVPNRVILWESISEAFGVLFGTTNNNAPGFPSVRFENFLFWYSWGLVILSLAFIFRPFIEKFLWTERDCERAREIVLKYGQNPASYLTLEEDKLLYFGKCCEGVLPYGIVGSTVVVNGDPVCRPEDFPAFLTEFREFCRRSSHALIFLSVTGQFLNEYKKQGFGIVKCGEEARFDLSTYDIAGKKGQKMRMNINHATNAGITVREYKPLAARNPEIEQAMQDITDEWLADKKSGMLKFTMGTTSLGRPMDRRYFYAVDRDGKICGYNVFCPFDGNRGYMADITRRSHNAPGGVTEKIMYEAFQVFKAEGKLCASMGIAPLANVIEDPEHPGRAEYFLNFIYEHLNSSYGFKNLYRAKGNYSPTEWLPGYYAWLPRIPGPDMFYAVVKIQNSGGLRDFAVSAIEKTVRRKDRNE